MRPFLAIPTGLPTAESPFRNRNYFTVPTFLVFFVWWGILVGTSPYAKERNRRRRVLQKAHSELRAAQAEPQRMVAYYEREYAVVYDRLAAAREQLGRLKADYDAEMQRIAKGVESQQLAAYLQTKFISDARIDKIGDGRKAVLESYGIETAFDIDSRRISVIPGFGPALTASLLAWRHGVEAQFKFNPAQGIPATEKQRVNLKFYQMQQALEITLRQGPEQLQTISGKSNEQLKALAQRIVQAASAVAQAEADLSVME